MEFQEAAQIVMDLPRPRTHPTRGRVLYRHILRNKPETLLELGTARGGSAVYIAAALEANGKGHLTSVDSRRWTFKDPTPREVLDKAGLADWVTLDKRFSTYTWFLKSEIEKQLRPSGSVIPKYDFIFLDGAKNWSTDGLAVILAEKLLRPGGWLLLDDLGWSYGKHVTGTEHYGLPMDDLSEEERMQPHLQAIFDLLIRTNPAFNRFVVQDDWWGWAHKSADMRGRRRGVLSGKRIKPTRPVQLPAQPPTIRRRIWARLPTAALQRIRGLRRERASANTVTR